MAYAVCVSDILGNFYEYKISSRRDEELGAVGRIKGHPGGIKNILMIKEILIFSDYPINSINRIIGQRIAQINNDRNHKGSKEIIDFHKAVFYHIQIV